MDYNTKRTWAEISLDNIEHNYRALKAALPDGCICLGVVKANAYGHGAVEVARRLESIDCGYLAVATIDEALELRENGITLPILILGPTPVQYAPELAANSLTQAVSEFTVAYEMSALVKRPFKIHIKLETGMGRTGFDSSDSSAIDDICRLLKLPNIDAEGIFTHFAVADVFGDEYTALQHNRFIDTVSAIQAQSGHSFRLVHCANSATVINYPRYAHDMARPGLALYGMYPAAEKGGIELRPSMTLKTRVAAITNHKKGDTISYGRTYTAERDMRVAVLPVGYADGLFRCLSGKLDFQICGKRVPQIGRICMDMCLADISDIPDCKVGESVTIFGSDIPIEELADKAGTINYELTCAVSRRVPRVYIP